MTPDIWCGIPVYNNAATIVDIATQCRELMPHVVVVDDGSTDADLRELLKSLDVHVIRHQTNLGKGEALLTAFRYAAQRGAKYLITIDGDGQHFPQDLPRFFPHLAPDTLLIGYRTEITGEMPRSSRFGREFSDFWICVEAGGSARDTQSGFRAYPLEAILKLQTNSRFYNFEMEIVTRALWAGLRTFSVPIHVWYPSPDQRVSSFDPFRDNLRISLLHTRLVLQQLLPIPHRRQQFARQGFSLRKVWSENSSPLGLSVSAGLSILMGIVLWPYGIFAIAYVTMRLHLNKIAALICLILCMPQSVPRVCDLVGQSVVRSRSHPHLIWIVGSHLVAIPIAVLVGWIVFAIAAYFGNPRGGPQRDGT